MKPNKIGKNDILDNNIKADKIKMNKVKKNDYQGIQVNHLIFDKIW